MLLKTSKFVKKRYLIVLISLFAATLRLVAIDGMPSSLNWDEISHGYNAYSIFKTGKDEWGFTLPTIFRAYGDYKLPVYIYLTAISEFFFGLNAFAVRLPSVLAGIGTVVFTYLLVKELSLMVNSQWSTTKKKRLTINHQPLAIISSLLVAVEPWSLFLSRGAFEANVALFFIVAGAYFFFKSFHTSNFLLLTSLFFGLSVWTYNSARIFVPLLIVVLVLLYKKELFNTFKNNNLKIYCLFIAAFFFLPMFYQLLNPVGQARYGAVQIIDEGAIAQIIEARQNTSFSPFVARLLYNRPVHFIQRFIANWASHFTCSFLFFEGGSHYQFSVPRHGLLYLVNLPFFFLGLILLLKRAISKDKLSIFILSWLLLAPIASSLTRESPHVLRSIVMLPMPMILTSYGVLTIIELFKKPFRYIVLMIYIIVTVWFLGNYLIAYFRNYRINYSSSWQYGYKQAVEYAKENYRKYDKIIVTKEYGEPHEFFLFYWPWDPEQYRNDSNLNRFYQSNWYWVDGFDKFYFVNDWDIPTEEWQPFVLESGGEFRCETITEDIEPFVEYDSEECLFITTPGKVPKGWSKLETINFLDGKPAFEIYEN